MSTSAQKNTNLVPSLRLIGLIAVYAGLAVQSVGFNKLRPLGDVLILVKTLLRWGVDEILILCLDRSEHYDEPDYWLLDRLLHEPIDIPLTMGGGVRTAAQAARLLRNGVDKVAVQNAILRNPQEVQNMAENVGAASMVASIPLGLYPGEKIPKLFDYRARRFLEVNPLLDVINANTFGELLVIDADREGSQMPFRASFLKQFASLPIPKTVCGGIRDRETISAVTRDGSVSGICLDSFLFHKEVNIRRLRSVLEAKEK